MGRRKTVARQKLTVPAILAVLMLGFGMCRQACAQPFMVLITKSTDVPNDVAFRSGGHAFKLGKPAPDFLRAFGPPDAFDGSTIDQSARWYYYADGVQVDLAAEEGSRERRVSRFTFFAAAKDKFAPAPVAFYIALDPRQSMRLTWFAVLDRADFVYVSRERGSGPRVLEVLCYKRWVGFEYTEGKLQVIRIWEDEASRRAGEAARTAAAPATQASDENRRKLEAELEAARRSNAQQSPEAPRPK